MSLAGLPGYPSRGCEALQAAAAEGYKSFAQLDKDKNGFLSMAEIFGDKVDRQSPARKAFDRADRDRNDWLNRKEFQALQKGGPKAGKKGGGKKKGRAKKGKKRR